MKQIVYYDADVYAVLSELIIQKNISDLMFVCDKAFEFLSIRKDVEKLGSLCTIHRFSDFSPNPTYESVCKGIDQYKSTSSSAVLAIGGGSALDVAKCIKLFSEMDSSKNYLEQEIVKNNIPLIAIPTTAGTGSEATRYAVIYYNGEKQSVTNDSCVPEYVFLQSELLTTLPVYQKKATMFDALCHCVESFWSVNSNEESRKISEEALKLLVENVDDYLSNQNDGNKNMLMAAHLAGKAINITQTTAGHALCYKITSLFGVSHGHAAVCCLVVLWKHMLRNMDKVCDSRGKEYVSQVFDSVAECFGVNSPEKAIGVIETMISDMGLSLDISLDDEKLDILVKSVNTTRLKNNPVVLTETDIRDIYIGIFK